MITAKPFPEWNDGSMLPPNEMLERASDTLIENAFFVTRRDGFCTIDRFLKSKKLDGTWYQGYWSSGHHPVRWMQLPE